MKVEEKKEEPAPVVQEEMAPAPTVQEEAPPTSVTPEPQEAPAVTPEPQKKQEPPVTQEPVAPKKDLVTPVASDVPIFKVQILVSSQKLKAGDSRLKGQTGVDSYVENGLTTMRSIICASRCRRSSPRPSSLPSRTVSGWMSNRLSGNSKTKE